VIEEELANRHGNAHAVWRSRQIDLPFKEKEAERGEPDTTLGKLKIVSVGRVL